MFIDDEIYNILQYTSTLFKHGKSSVWLFTKRLKYFKKEQKEIDTVLPDCRVGVRSTIY